MHKLRLNAVAWRKIFVMPRVRGRNAYQPVSDFDRGLIVVYQDCDLSYRSTVDLVDQYLTISFFLFFIYKCLRVIRNVVLDYSRPLSLTVEQRDILTSWP